MVPVMLTFYDSDLKTVKGRSRSRLQSVHKFQRKNKNIISFYSNIIIFLVIKERANSLGVPGF